MKDIILENRLLLEKMILEKNMRDLLQRNHILQQEKNQFIRRVQEERLRQEARLIQKAYERQIDLKNHSRILTEKMKSGKPITMSDRKAFYKAEAEYRQALYKADELKAKAWVRGYFDEKNKAYQQREKKEAKTALDKLKELQNREQPTQTPTNSKKSLIR